KLCDGNGACVGCLGDGDCQGPAVCDAGHACAGPSCVGLPPTCGPHGDESCCASTLVPGGTYKRSYDGLTYTDATNPATVSDFRLDRFEVTVGRFRAFLDAYPGSRPAPGAGANPSIPASGWDPANDYYLAADKASFVARMKGFLDAACIPYTWTD